MAGREGGRREERNMEWVVWCMCSVCVGGSGMRREGG